MGLDKYVRQTGLSYQLVPVLAQGAVDVDVAYNNVMTKFAFGNAKNPNVYFDEENRRHLNSMRYAFSQIAQALVAAGKKDSAQKVLRKFDEETNERNFPYGMTSNRGNQHNYFSYVFLQACYASGEMKLAKKVSASLLKDLKQEIVYYKSLGEPMSEDQFILNTENAYQNKPNNLSTKQMSFVQDVLTCGQIIDGVTKMEKDFAPKG